LGAIGFGAAGPVAGEPHSFVGCALINLPDIPGSFAALIQATFYGGAVRTGSLFAMAQAAAMGGIAVGSAQVAAGVVVAGAGAGMALTPKRNGP
jgi:hypothetical protein